MRNEKLLTTYVVPLMSLLALTSQGCSSKNQENDAWVRSQVEERLDKRVQWNQARAEDAEAALAVSKILEETLSIDAAVQIALLNNPSLQAAFEEIGVAQADLVAAGLLHNPIFDTYLRFPMPSSQKINAQFAVAFSFLDIFMIPLKKKAATFEFEKVRADVAHAVLTLAYDVEEVFYRYQNAVAQMELQTTLLDISEVAYALATRQKQAGNINPLFLDEKRAAFEENKLMREKLEMEATSYRERLSTLLGFSKEDHSWHIAGWLSELPAEELAFSELEDRAVQRRFDVLAAQKEILWIAQLGAQKKWWSYTDLQLGASAEGETDGTWEAGPALSMALPFFDFGQADRARLAALLKQSREKLKALEVQVRSDVRLAQQKIQNARFVASEYSRIVIPLRARIVDSAERMFNVMTYGIYDLLEDKRREVLAHMHFEEALCSYWIARAELLRAVGGYWENDPK